MTQPDPSWTAPPPKKSKARGCITVIGGIVLVIILITIIAVIAGGGKDSNTSSKTPTANHKTQAQEVTLTKCDSPDVIGAVYVEGTASNGSSKRSDYFIDVRVTTPAGVQIGTGSTIVQNVEPGATALWKALTDTEGAKWVKGSTCEVVKVERNASL